MRTETVNTSSIAALLRHRTLDRRGWHRRLLEQRPPAPRLGDPRRRTSSAAH